MRPPEVYGAINAVIAEVARIGLPKQNFNVQDDYFYRSIDDVMSCLAPLLAAHRLCVLPRVLKRSAVDRPVPPNTILSHVTIKIAFDLVSVDDGSCHTVVAFGEALDDNDKATAKAMSAAYKSAMLQSFCIPVVGADHPDRSKVPSRKNHDPAPVQGWEQWSQDVIAMIKACESEEALSRVQNTNRALLKAVQRERNQTYLAIGEEFAARRAALLSTREADRGVAHVKRTRGRPRKAQDARGLEIA